MGLHFTRILHLVVFFAAIFEGNPSRARVVFVSPDGDNSDGQSWTTAFRSIARGLDKADFGDEIWVRRGVYHERIRMREGVDLFGGFAGTESLEEFGLRDWENNVTTIDASGLNRRAVIGEENAMLDGFTITGGGREGHVGGGIVCDKTSPIVANCKIDRNTSRGELDSECEADCYPCGFYDICCDSFCFFEVDGGRGGGVYLEKSFATFINCEITNNRASADFDAFGGGVYIEEGAPTFSECKIMGNEARSEDSEGGGIHLFDTSSPVFTNCVFGNNDCLGRDSIGGGVFVLLGGAEFVNCTIAGNRAEHKGGGFFVDEDSSVRIRNSIVWGNSPESIFVYEGNARVDFSDVEGGWEGDGNIDADPLFVSAGSGDFGLREGSPAIDVAGTTGPDNDIDGNPRPVDIPGIGREGDGFEFDMGAFEVQVFVTPTASPTPINPPGPTPTPIQTLEYDLVEDGWVDVQDLLELLRSGMDGDGIEKGLTPFKFSLEWERGTPKK